MEKIKVLMRDNLFWIRCCIDLFVLMLLWLLVAALNQPIRNLVEDMAPADMIINREMAVPLLSWGLILTFVATLVAVERALFVIYKVTRRDGNERPAYLVIAALWVFCGLLVAAEVGVGSWAFAEQAEAKVARPTLDNVTGDPVAASHAAHAAELARQLAELKAASTWEGKTYYNGTAAKRKTQLERELGQARAEQARALGQVREANTTRMDEYKATVAEKRNLAAWKGRGISLATLVLFFFAHVFGTKRTVDHLGTTSTVHLDRKSTDKRVTISPEVWGLPPTLRRNGHHHPAQTMGEDAAK